MKIQKRTSYEELQEMHAQHIAMHSDQFSCVNDVASNFKRQIFEAELRRQYNIPDNSHLLITNVDFVCNGENVYVATYDIYCYDIDILWT